MDIKKSIVITITEDDLKQIVVDYLKKEGHNTTKDKVSFSVASRLEGFGMGEYEVKYLEKCVAVCEEE